MGEESHLDEMRSAIRGDFERLAERRGEQELMRVDAEEPDPASSYAESVTIEDEEPKQPRRSWFARFVSS